MDTSTGHTVGAAPSRGRVSLSDRARRQTSGRKIGEEGVMRRVVSHHVESSRVSNVFRRKEETRRSVTGMEEDWLQPGGRAKFVRGDGREVVLQGYCRMNWFIGIRCTRFLRLAKRQLECFDGALRKRLWVVAMDGARVRIQMRERKIVLSKLDCGYVIEFYVGDEQSCKDWAAALLRASSSVGACG